VPEFTSDDPSFRVASSFASHDSNVCIREPGHCPLATRTSNPYWNGRLFFEYFCDLMQLQRFFGEANQQAAENYYASDVSAIDP
jgi:hypothetical protein